MAEKKYTGLKAPVKILLCILTAIVAAIYLPFYFQKGVRSDSGFLTEKDGVFSSSSLSITVSDGTLTFSDPSLSPLTVSEEDGFYTVSLNGDVLYSGRMPDETSERRILSDGTLTLPDDSSPGYPLSLSRIILIGTGGSETRGQQHYLLIAAVSIAIWLIDILFPDFFFKSDFRNFGSSRTPSPTYRKAQRILWILFPLWSAVFLVLALL